MVIFLNPYCGYGHGLARWERIESELTSKAGSFILEAIQSPESLPARVSMFMQSGETEFVAAGGDGTVNLLLNAILSAHEGGNGVFFGAIGLGSSNDYHKPLDQREFVGQVPVRINRQKSRSL